MNRQEYLQRLQAELKGFSAEEQAELIEEIAAHFDDSQSDPLQQGSEARLEREMGRPEDLGRGLKAVHRPKRWLDYALVVVPEVIVFPLLSLLMALIFPFKGVELTHGQASVYWGIRMVILLEAALVGASLWLDRRQGAKGLLFFWVPATWLSIFSLCYRENRWQWRSTPNAFSFEALESLFWLALLAVIAAWLVYQLWRTRDPLLMTLALLPFLSVVGNLATNQMLLAGGFENGYTLPNWRIGWYFGLAQVVTVVWPALFYLFRQRPVRWLGLFVHAAPFALMNLIASLRYPHLIALWSLPVLLVLASWLVDGLSQQRKPAITR